MPWGETFTHFNRTLPGEVKRHDQHLQTSLGLKLLKPRPHRTSVFYIEGIMPSLFFLNRSSFGLCPNNQPLKHMQALDQIQLFSTYNAPKYTPK